MPVALTRYNTDDRLTRVTSEFCRRTIRQVEKLQKEFRKLLGTTFAFLGDEIYIKAGRDIPSRRHYGNYPQIEDGVGMVRTFWISSNESCRNRLRQRTASLAALVQFRHAHPATGPTRPRQFPCPVKLAARLRRRF